MTDSIRGRIVLYATVFCVACYIHLETDQHTRNAASRYAKDRGWHFDNSWYCPYCYQKNIKKAGGESTEAD
jgi:hypothetical protein